MAGANITADQITAALKMLGITPDQRNARRPQTVAEQKADAVARHQDCEADYYIGTQADLIAARVCKAVWFPERLMMQFKLDGTPHTRKGRQRIKRTYKVQNQSPEITLTHRVDSQGAEYWVVRIAVSDEERQHREDAEYAKWAQGEARRDREKAAEEDQRGRARLERLRHLLRSLPQFIPGSMSEGEKHHMRVWRGLTPGHRDLLTDLCERMLSRGETVTKVEVEVEYEVDQIENANHGLRLVVDNDQ